jgi:hypothetical protein
MEPKPKETTQSTPFVLPDAAVEREVPYYFEEFTLSGGCCADGLGDGPCGEGPSAFGKPS